jgi:1,4-alpha-glucan branching enzyme
MVVANFTNKPIVAYELPFPYGGNWKVRFNSDWKGYGNDFTDTQISDVMIEAGKGKVNLGPYSIIVLSPET